MSNAMPNDRQNLSATEIQPTSSDIALHAEVARRLADGDAPDSTICVPVLPGLTIDLPIEELAGLTPHHLAEILHSTRIMALQTIEMYRRRAASSVQCASWCDDGGAYSKHDGSDCYGEPFEPLVPTGSDLSPGFRIRLSIGRNLEPDLRAEAMLPSETSTILLAVQPPDVDEDSYVELTVREAREMAARLLRCCELADADQTMAREVA